MKTGFASGRMNGTKQVEQQPKELKIMDGAVAIRKGTPVYQFTRRAWSIWPTKLVKTA